MRILLVHHPSVYVLLPQCFIRRTRYGFRQLQGVDVWEGAVPSPEGTRDVQSSDGSLAFKNLLSSPASRSPEWRPFYDRVVAVRGGFLRPFTKRPRFRDFEPDRPAPRRKSVVRPLTPRVIRAFLSKPDSIVCETPRGSDPERAPLDSPSTLTAVGCAI